MTGLTSSQKDAINTSTASLTVFEAMLKQFDAAEMMGNPKSIASARDSVHSALDAWLDAKSRLIAIAKL